jgi:hypothetical protein
MWSLEFHERLFGYAPRLTHDKLRIARALEDLPESTRELRAGSATWSSLRELTRVATPETERSWLEAARGQTVRQIEQLVSGHRPGDMPGSPKSTAAERHVLRFEVSGEVLAIFREAMVKLRREAASSLDDDAALLLMARQVLEGPLDDGRASSRTPRRLAPRSALLPGARLPARDLRRRASHRCPRRRRSSRARKPAHALRRPSPRRSSRLLEYRGDSRRKPPVSPRGRYTIWQSTLVATCRHALPSFSSPQAARLQRGRDTQGIERERRPRGRGSGGGPPAPPRAVVTHRECLVQSFLKARCPPTATSP